MTIDSIAASARSGKPMAALRLPDGVRLDIVLSTLDAHETDQAIARRIAPQMRASKVTASSLFAFLKRARREYKSLVRVRAHDLESFDTLMNAYDRDPSARARIVVECFARRVFATLIESDGEPLCGDPEWLRELTRMVECVIGGAEADSKITLTRERASKLRAEIRRLDRDRESGATKGDMQQMMRAFFAAVGRDDLFAPRDPKTHRPTKPVKGGAS